LATISTLGFKAVFAFSFVLPFIFFPLDSAVFFALIYGTILLVAFSYIVAKADKNSITKTIGEHLFVFVLVLCITYFLGNFIKNNLS
jgi:VIT1/CCC1 family predicted Fe2+/Mn2+ transporter